MIQLILKFSITKNKVHIKTGIVIFLLLFMKAASAQYNDAGLWLTINGEKKITHAFSFSLAEEFRMDENISELGEFFTDAGVNYKINKYIRLSANYRFAKKKKKDNFFYVHNQFYFDIALKKKFKPFSFEFRTRQEDEYKQPGKASDYTGPNFISKNKFTVKLEYNKKITPFLSFETFTPLNNAELFPIYETRYYAGAEYDFNRVHSLELYFLLKKDCNVKYPETDYILGVEYDLTF